MKYIVIFLTLIISMHAQDKHSKMLVGANALYWEETDKVRSQDDYIDILKKLKIKIMRFPGGEVADNYDWRTNTLNNPKRWPSEKNVSDSIDRMDFDEFITLQKELGSEPIIVINLENGFVTGNLEEASNIAAEWVKYANIKMDYNVKYWEIGNESYHMSTRYPLSAKEYARAFNLFSEKMKEIDPTIKIGAIGPFNVKHCTFFDKLTIENKQKVRKIKNGKKRMKVAKEYLSKQKQIQAVKWWDVILDESGQSLDFIVLHHYITVRKVNADMKKHLRIKQNIKRMNVFTVDKIGKELPIFVTEWNISKNHALNKKNYFITIKEAEKSFFNSGVKALLFWPLRPTIKNKFTSMIDLSKDQE